MAQEQFTDAIALLKADHAAVHDLFARFQQASGRTQKWEIAQQICDALKIHATIEEEIFYPASKGAVEDGLFHEAIVEHDGAKVLVNDILANGPEDEFFEAKVTVLGEEITHHVGEEERPVEGYFAQVRAGDVDLVELRDRLLARQRELKAKADNGGLPPAEMAALHVEPA